MTPAGGSGGSAASSRRGGGLGAASADKGAVGRACSGGGGGGKIPRRFLPVCFTERGSKDFGSRRLSPRPRRGVRGSGGCGEPEPSPGGRCASRPVDAVIVVIIIITIVFRLLGFGDLAEISFAPDRKVWGSPRCPCAASGHFQRFR